MNAGVAAGEVVPPAAGQPELRRDKPQAVHHGSGVILQAGVLAGLPLAHQQNSTDAVELPGGLQLDSVLAPAGDGYPKRIDI